MAFQVTEINECHNSQVVRSHEFVLLESCKPSCEGVIVFNYICSWFQGGNSQSWICELFPQSFPAELWSFQAAVDAVSAACLGCAGTAVVHYCSTLEMETKESLKIPNLYYCLLNPNALDSHIDSQSSHPVEAKLTFSAVVPVCYSHWSCTIQNNNFLHFKSWFASHCA